ncbi:MAG TPA: 5-deoxy-glucuronate isomerase, partial [Alphaproteobacteria bacterium]|nr:5-deoxy-glucuronate isomerase [Alphaproteobacteria bacterium]
MADLLVKPTSGTAVHDITPQSAGWGHVGFGLHDLGPGGVIEGSGDGNELCIVLLSGAASLKAGDVDFGHIQGRESVFDGVPAHAFYVPMQTAWKV